MNRIWHFKRFLTPKLAIITVVIWSIRDELQLSSNCDVLMNFSTQIWESSSFLCLCTLLELLALHRNPVRITAKKQENPCVFLSYVVIKETETLWTVATCRSKGISAGTLHMGCSSNYTSFSRVAEMEPKSACFHGFFSSPQETSTFKQIKQLQHKCYYLPDVCILEMTQKDN